MQIDVQVLDKHFYLKKLLLKRFCRKVIQNAWKGKPDVQISVVLADNDFVQLLNKRYRKKDKPTNVLSFENEWPLAGDIIVAYGVTRDEAIAQGKTFAAHLAHLLTHGTLHLQKYDHLTEKQAQKMEKMETKLMRQLGYADPYKGV
ncbi:MAG: rRNA maturation RNase YbeY [Alphaproteobacteria bacterium]|nr:rRNA maturation RNase YbeY [Alphaproteobacteria bacterium]